MVRYLETFFRHRLLLTAPILVALLAGIGWVLAQPRTYQATAKIWFDPPINTDTSSNSINTVSAADQQVLVFQELQHTRAFATEVGRRGPLAAYLATPQGYGEAADPMTAAQSRIMSLARGQFVQPTQDQLRSLVYQNLNSKLSVTADGPEIITLTYDSGNPEVAAGTLGAVLDEFAAEVLQGKRNQAQAGVDFYAAQVKVQAAEVTRSDEAVAQYISDHPEQASALTIPDTTISGLRRSQDQARQRYDALVGKLDQSELQLAALSGNGTAGFRVIDPPALPTSPLSLRSKLLLGVAGGLVAGLLISLLSIVVLTLSDSSLRRPADVESALGLRVVGSLRRVDGMGR